MQLKARPITAVATVGDTTRCMACPSKGTITPDHSPSVLLLVAARPVFYMTFAYDTLSSTTNTVTGGLEVI